MTFRTAIIVFDLLIIGFFIVSLIYLIANRLEEKKQENFEKRDN